MHNLSYLARHSFRSKGQKFYRLNTLRVPARERNQWCEHLEEQLVNPCVQQNKTSKVVKRARLKTFSTRFCFTYISTMDLFAVRPNGITDKFA